MARRDVSLRGQKRLRSDQKPVSGPFRRGRRAREPVLDPGPVAAVTARRARPPLGVRRVRGKNDAARGLVEFRFFVSPEAGAAVDASAPGWKPWHEITRDRERRTLEAFEGVRRRVRSRGAPSSRDAGPDAARIAAARENAETGRVDDVVDLTGDVEAEAEPGEVAPVAPQTAEGRVWFLAPAGKLSSASQSYEALHHVRRLHAPMRDAMLRPTETLRNGRSRRDVDDPPPRVRGRDRK